MLGNCETGYFTVRFFTNVGSDSLSNEILLAKGLIQAAVSGKQRPGLAYARKRPGQDTLSGIFPLNFPAQWRESQVGGDCIKGYFSAIRHQQGIKPDGHEARSVSLFDAPKRSCSRGDEKLPISFVVVFNDRNGWKLDRTCCNRFESCTQSSACW